MIDVDRCYVCRTDLARRHERYELLCPPCGETNWAHRHAVADLRGWTALVTGGRIKIGFATALMLLRWGARVVVTSRFAADALRRFGQQPDAAQWIDRLQVLPADFRALASVEGVVRHVAEEVGELDILVNNAAQTLRRPPAFYRHLVPSADRVGVDAGGAALMRLVAPANGVASLDLAAPDDVAALSLVPLLPEDRATDPTAFPAGCFDKDGQPEDRRRTNSWMSRLDDVQIVEMLEVMYINVVAPFVLCSRLKPLLARRRHGHAFIINVSAMEGVFDFPDKSVRHPHTNMAKAALNMLTRTSASELFDAGVLMNAVDPGWITDETPFPPEQERVERRSRMAIDEVDGAARVCMPIRLALHEGDLTHGALFKNYRVRNW